VICPMAETRALRLLARFAPLPLLIPVRLAMQKVVGSNPISRFQRSPRKAGVSRVSEAHRPEARHGRVNSWVNTLQPRRTLDSEQERVLRREAQRSEGQAGRLSDTAKRAAQKRRAAR
jgi:hypothetical protein